MDDVGVYRIRCQGDFGPDWLGCAICGLSGGVDSSVAALLVHKAIGDRLSCVFVDNGLLRKNEFESVLANFRDRFHLKVIGVDARERFLSRLRDVEDPETKAQDHRRGIHPGF